MKKYMTRYVLIFLSALFLSACVDDYDEDTQEPDVIAYDSYGTTMSGFRPRSSEKANLQEIDGGLLIESNVSYDEVENELDVLDEGDFNRVAPITTNGKTIAQRVLEEDLVLTVYFAVRSTDIAAPYLPEIKKHVEFMAKNPDVLLHLKGHADERGSREFNLALSQNRALVIKDVMLKHGADPDRIKSVGYGEEQPVALGEGEAYWSKNRRAQFHYELLQE